MSVDSLSERLRQKSVTEVQGEGVSPSCVSETILASFEQAIHEDHPRLLWMAQRIVHRWEIAEEIVQESLLKAFKALPRFRGDARMRTWLCAIVRNATLEHLRSQREPLQVSLENFVDGDGLSIYDPPDSRNNPEADYESAELLAILLEEVDGLGPCSKSAFQMCTLEQSTQSEAAAAFKVSVGKIKSRVCRARRVLSTRMRQRVGLVPPARDQVADSARSLGLDEFR